MAAGELYLEFTHIDQSNPTRSFGFAVQVVGEDDEYRGGHIVTAHLVFPAPAAVVAYTIEVVCHAVSLEHVTAAILALYWAVHTAGVICILCT